MKLHMLVCRGQLKTSHTNIVTVTYYFCLNDFDIFALTIALRSNVDKLLGPGRWNFTCEFVVDS
jgi:hypothetical protein